MPAKCAKTPSRGPARGTSDLRRAEPTAPRRRSSPTTSAMWHSWAFRFRKNMLTEALLAATGAITRKGTIAEGTTVSDSDPSAIAQQRSVALAVVPVTVGDVKSTCWTLRAIRISSASCAPGCARPMRCSLSSQPPTMLTPRPPRSGASANGSACRGPWSSAGWTIRARISTPPSPCLWPSATPSFRSTFRSARMAAVTGLLGLLSGTVSQYGPGGGARRPRRDRRRTCSLGVREGRADRGDHCRKRGRVAHGPLPRGEEIDAEVLIADLEQRWPGVLSPGAAGVGGVRARPDGTARGPGGGPFRRRPSMASPRRQTSTAFPRSRWM